MTSQDFLYHDKGRRIIRSSKPHRNTVDYFADAIALLSKDLQEFREEINHPFEDLNKKIEDLSLFDE